LRAFLPAAVHDARDPEQKNAEEEAAKNGGSFK
jgi:hypothetical protein